MKFSKYHGLGNDYLVFQPDTVKPIGEEQIQCICDRNYGVGSDGILLGPLPSNTCDFRLRIFNPDGSEAEKSGNGLRIFEPDFCLPSPFAVHDFSLALTFGP